MRDKGLPRASALLAMAMGILCCLFFGTAPEREPSELR